MYNFFLFVVSINAQIETNIVEMIKWGNISLFKARYFLNLKYLISLLKSYSNQTPRNVGKHRCCFTSWD